MGNFSSLVCWNTNKNNTFICGCFNNNDRKPILGTCGHTVCAKCVENDSSMKCPICQQEGAFTTNRINFPILENISQHEKKSVEVFEKWWSEKIIFNGKGYCFQCNTDNQKLQFCYDCSMSSICYFGNQAQLDDSGFNIGKLNLKNLVIMLTCVNCLRETEHSRHKVISWSQVEHAEEHLKKATFPLAEQFLTSNVKKEKGMFNCKLRQMDMLQRFEKLLQKIQEYFQNFPESPLVSEELVQVDKLLSDSKKTWREYTCGGNNDIEVLPGPKCSCTELWDDLAKHNRRMEADFGFGKMLGRAMHDGCPLEFEENKLEKEWMLLTLRHFKGTVPAANRVIGNMTQREQNLTIRENNVQKREENVFIRETNVTIREDNLTARE